MENSKYETFKKNLKSSQNKVNWKTIKKIHQNNIDDIVTQLYDVYVGKDDNALIETRMMNKSIRVNFDFNEEDAHIFIEGCHTGGNSYHRDDFSRTIPICDKAPKMLWRKITEKYA